MASNPKTRTAVTNRQGQPWLRCQSASKHVEIAAQIDEGYGVTGKTAREADWTGVVSGKALEKKYRMVSERRPRGLKGKECWVAMAKYASEHPRHADDENKRPFWVEIRVALQSRVSNYAFQKQSFGFNLDTFEMIDLRQ